MKKILIADDDTYIIESTLQMLSPFYYVDTATTGSEALALFVKNNYDCLISDVDFGPGMNGLELVFRLRKHNHGCKIIIVSGIHYADAVRQRAIDMGAVFTERPLTFEFVQRVMES